MEREDVVYLKVAVMGERVYIDLPMDGYTLVANRGEVAKVCCGIAKQAHFTVRETGE